MNGIKPLWWMACLVYYRWASNEISPHNPDVAKVYMRRLHYEQLLGIGTTRPMYRTIPVQRPRLVDSCTGPVFDMADGGSDGGGGE